MKRLKSIVLAALAIFVVGATLPTPSVSAQSSSSSLGTVPKKSYQLEAGASQDDKLTIRNNDSKATLQLYLQVVDFTYSDDTGSAKFLLNTNNDPTTWSLRSYLSVPESVTVDPGESKSVDMNVKLPSNIGAGSYYSAIIYSTSAPDGGNVGLSASTATLVFVNVPGSVNENLTIEKFGAYNSDKKSYYKFSMNEPKTIAYTVKNDSNVTEAPVGTIKLSGWFGKEYTINEVNPNKSLALIGQTRTFQACIKTASQDVNFKGTEAEQAQCVSPGLWPGVYQASIDVFYGQNGNVTKELTKTSWFVYLPLWFIIASGIVILVATFYIWRTVVFIRGGTFRIGVGPRVRKSSRRGRR